jgi:methylated-DNA-[protein]-cysteine S-methyltransferase
MQYIYQSPLGPLIVTIMNDQIISVVFGQKQSGNIGAEDTVMTKPMKRQLDSYFAGKLMNFDLPVQYEGTPFQMKVWKYLQTIPYGKTVSYQTVAKSIGHPKSARAVGTACKHNPIPIIIPCHRVISATGAFGEYAGGKTRKIKLLKLEGG